MYEKAAGWSNSKAVWGGVSRCLELEVQHNLDFMGDFCFKPNRKEFAIYDEAAGWHYSKAVGGVCF